MASLGSWDTAYGDDISDAPVSVTLHGSDGFTLSGMRDGYLVEHRFIGWTVSGARRVFRAYLRGKVSTPTGGAA